MKRLLVLALLAMPAAADTDYTSARFRPETLKPFKEFNLAAHCFALSPDARRVAWFGNSTVTVTSTLTAQAQVEFDGFAAGVHDGAFSRDGNLLAVCGNDKSVKIFSVREKKEIAAFGPYNNYSCSIGFSPDGKRACGSIANESRILVWNFEEKKEEIEISDSMDTCYSIWFDTTGNHILGSTSNYDLLVYDVRKKEREKELLQAAATYVPIGAFTSDGRYLLTPDPGKPECTLWETATWKQSRTFETKANVKWVAIAPGNRYFAAASHEGAVQIVNFSTGKVVREFPCEKTSNMNASIRVAISKDGRYLCYATRGGLVTVYAGH